MLYMGYIKLLTTEITGVICCNTFFMFHSHCHLKIVCCLMHAAMAVHCVISFITIIPSTPLLIHTGEYCTHEHFPLYVETCYSGLKRSILTQFAIVV